ncbi:3-phosphoinositide-dependent protein kinase 1-like [Liolophura sinensis]|uniref:3-phosphoinositide-dependent protein kinase 1-like n=1 Tax=Liolophura sinensis TaxID=3198878 RepID=UPI0031587C8C
MSVLKGVNSPSIQTPPSPTTKDMAVSGEPDKLVRKSSTKRTPNDFIFGKVIGEGSYSTVYLSKELSTGKEFAIKVLEKRHIIRERKQQYVMRERDVFNKIGAHPFFIQMYYTFQDPDRLYFVLTYARRGELLDYLHKLSSFDENCTRFYSAELVVAIEYLHSLGIIHRDLKPENILLNDEMHIQITDFGSAKMIKTDVDNTDKPETGRKKSFVGTAQYVSPEILTSKDPHCSTDLWALGCIIYQLLSGLPPFRGGHEYQIFQKITKLEYEFPEGFGDTARDLVEKLLVLEPSERLGCEEKGGMKILKNHEFYKGIQWDTLHEQKPPELTPYLPSNSLNSQLWSKNRPGLDDARIGEIIADTVLTDDERKIRLEEQIKSNEYHRFVEGNLILKQGLLDKRKGLFARRRMFLMTEGPHLYYVDPANKVLKGQVPWSKELHPEVKTFKIFFIHTPNRTYYLEDHTGHAQDWCKAIEDVWQRYYGDKDKHY